MNFSYQWLRELVPGLELTPEQLAQQITMRTAECEGVMAAGGDSLIEINNKSLTNRPDLWGHYGMAREVAAFAGLALTDPVGTLPVGAAGPISIAIEDAELCPRYSAVLVEGVTIGPSPEWLRRRLTELGHGSRNLVVDLTNYVAQELGQPTHAFDADRFGTAVEVRRATAGAAFAALNGESYELSAEDTVIAGGKEVGALAGVIGGASTAISEGTTRVLLEAATFAANAVRKTSSRLHLRTDASMRFEKGQDPENTMRALARIVALLQQEMPEARVVAVADEYPRPIVRPTVALDLDWAERRLGRRLETGVALGIFESLAFGVEQTGPRTFALRVPTWRATKDISIAEDLLEELGRMLGYDSIEGQAPAAAVAEARVNPVQDQIAAVRTLMVHHGFTEVSNYSFCSDAAVEMFGFDTGLLLRLANPIVSDQNSMRPDLVPGIHKNLVDNSRYLTDFRLFEVGRTYTKGPDGKAVERLHCAAAVYGLGEDAGQLFELKGVAELLVPGLVAVPAEGVRTFEHPRRTAVLQAGKEVVGRLFELNPTLLSRGRAAVFTLDLDALRALPKRKKMYVASSRFPTSTFDLSIVAEGRVAVGALEELLKTSGGAAVLGVKFLQVFELADGRKSVSFRLTVGDAERTITSEEIAGIRGGVIAGLEAAGFGLRE